MTRSAHVSAAAATTTPRASSASVSSVPGSDARVHSDSATASSGSGTTVPTPPAKTPAEAIRHSFAADASTSLNARPAAASSRAASRQPLVSGLATRSASAAAMAEGAEAPLAPSRSGSRPRQVKPHASAGRASALSRRAAGDATFSSRLPGSNHPSGVGKVICAARLLRLAPARAAAAVTKSRPSADAMSRVSCAANVAAPGTAAAERSAASARFASPSCARSAISGAYPAPFSAAAPS